jgi:hypothetical protein
VGVGVARARARVKRSAYFKPEHSHVNAAHWHVVNMNLAHGAVSRLRHIPRPRCDKFILLVYHRTIQ